MTKTKNFLSLESFPLIVSKATIKRLIETTERVIKNYRLDPDFFLSIQDKEELKRNPTPENRAKMLRHNKNKLRIAWFTASLPVIDLGIRYLTCLVGKSDGLFLNSIRDRFSEMEKEFKGTRAATGKTSVALVEGAEALMEEVKTHLLQVMEEWEGEEAKVFEGTLLGDS